LRHGDRRSLPLARRGKRPNQRRPMLEKSSDRPQQKNRQKIEHHAGAAIVAATMSKRPACGTHGRGIDEADREDGAAIVELRRVRQSSPPIPSS
jgi:hypothetical protein